MTDKALLRHHQKKLLRTLPAAGDHGAEIAASFHKAFTLNPADILALYWPMPHEVDPRPLLNALACAFALPVVAARGAPLTFRAYQPGDTLSPDLMGIMAPSADAAPVTPTHVLVPLLAFDRKGYRLGRGGGYYDRTLAALPQAVHIGLAHSAQVVPAVPVEPHDQRLHYVVTPEGVIDCRTF